LGEVRVAYRVLVWKPEGKRPYASPRFEWEDNIKRDLQEVGWGGMDWIDLTQVAGTYECCNEHSVSIKCGEFLE
jgi:hypothetical protein